MKSYFKHKDFLLCEVPVPKGYPQSQTHSGVSYSNGHFYLVTSPHPFLVSKFFSKTKGGVLTKRLLQLVDKMIRAKQKWNRADLYENPCIYTGFLHDKEKYPIRFTPVEPFPLIDTPDNENIYAFNSDPDVFIKGEMICVLNRPRYVWYKEGMKNVKETIDLIMGKVNEKTGEIYDLETFIHFKDISGGSPCISFFNNEFVLLKIIPFANWMTGVPARKGSVSFVKSSSIELIKDNENWEEITVNSPDDYYPYHFSVFQYKNTLYSIVTCIKKGIRQLCWNFLGEFSADLKNLYIYRLPLTDYSSYRSGACVVEDGEFVFYNTTVAEKIKGGKSVDGREIVMAHCSFEEMLIELKKSVVF